MYRLTEENMGKINVQCDRSGFHRLSLLVELDDLEGALVSNACVGNLGWQYQHLAGAR